MKIDASLPLKRHLLIVDDEENILFSLKRLLRIDGYTILTASNAHEAFDILESHPVGVIISDQRMPQMKGSVFLSKVKERYPDTIRIMLSGYTELDSVTDAINRGAIYRFLTKPWDDDLLRKNIQEAFTYFELKSANEQLAKNLKKACDLLEKNNQELEERVEKKTREIHLKSHALELSRDILESLPIGVIGISDNLQIAVSNKRAIDLIANNKNIIGHFTHEVFNPRIQTALKDIINHKPCDQKETHHSIKNANNDEITLSIQADRHEGKIKRITILLWITGEYEHVQPH